MPCRDRKTLRRREEREGAKRQTAKGEGLERQRRKERRRGNHVSPRSFAFDALSFCSRHLRAQPVLPQASWGPVRQSVVQEGPGSRGVTVDSRPGVTKERECERERE